MFERLSRRLDGMEREMVAFQQAITAIPALSPRNGGEGEWKKTVWIEHYLRSCGVTDLEWVNAPDPAADQGLRPNLIARIPGRQESSRVWIMAHTDVVPVGDLSRWTHSPWEAVESNGCLTGRGVEDNQQGLTSAVFAAAALLAEGVVPQRSLGLILCADEETGSAFGLDYVLKQRPGLFRPDDLIVVPDAGNAESTLIDVAEKGILWLCFTVKGKQVHGSMPQDGVNACRAGADLICRLERLYELFPHRDELFVPPISTFEPTQKMANVPNVNTIPGEDIFKMDCRIMPEYSLEEVQAAIRVICDQVERDRLVSIVMTAEHALPSAVSTPHDAPVVRGLQSAIEAVYGAKALPRGIGGGTVAASFRRSGLPAAVWSTQGHSAHQPDETCVIARMVGDAKVFVHLCLQQE